jgi:putative membrane protein insertion efficiency factor
MSRAQAPVGESPAVSEGEGGGREPGVAARAALALIGVYQQYRVGRPTGCRFIPTCSAYADEAIRIHGAGRGTLLAVRRLMRCHPWGGHGVDPVPDRSAVCSH